MLLVVYWLWPETVDILGVIQDGFLIAPIYFCIHLFLSAGRFGFKVAEKDDTRRNQYDSGCDDCPHHLGGVAGRVTVATRPE